MLADGAAPPGFTVAAEPATGARYYVSVATGVRHWADSQSWLEVLMSYVDPSWRAAGTPPEFSGDGCGVPSRPAGANGLAEETFAAHADVARDSSGVFSRLVETSALADPTSDRTRDSSGVFSRPVETSALAGPSGDHDPTSAVDGSLLTPEFIFCKFGSVVSLRQFFS